MNNEIAASFASLVKSNNGFFKSEKQAAFLLSKCQDGNTFVCGGHVYRNPFTLYYVCDASGVVRVEKYTSKTGKNVTTWTRQSDEAFQASQAAKEASKARDIAVQAAAMAKFQARQDAFQKALEIAQQVAADLMIEDGRSEELAKRVACSVIKDQDSIITCMDALVKSSEFVAAWEAFNNEPGR